MLQTLTIDQLNSLAAVTREKIRTFDRRLTQLNREMNFEHTVTVDRCLPELSAKSRKVLQTEFPEFFTDTRRAVFNKNAKFFFGLITPGSHDHVLVLLQSQLRAYLSARGTPESREIAGLTYQLASLRVELTAIERERVSRPTGRPVPAAGQPASSPRVQPSSPSARPRPVERRYEVESLRFDDDDITVPFVNAVLQADALRCQPAPVIATDDRLGCYS